MHILSDKYLLQIEPEHQKTYLPINDDLTQKMEDLLSSAIEGVFYVEPRTGGGFRGLFRTGDSWRGLHCCVCGEMSGSKDLLVRSGHITNSLAVHYLRWHRTEVPESEIKKLESI